MMREQRKSRFNGIRELLLIVHRRWNHFVSTAEYLGYETLSSTQGDSSLESRTSSLMPPCKHSGGCVIGDKAQKN